MKNTTHRVVILNDVKSEIISQAILILKNPDGVCESAVLAEAEKIVEKYMLNTPPDTEKNEGKFMVSFLCMSALLFLGLFIFALIKIF